MERTEQRLIVLMGASGAGKTTWANEQKLLQNLDGFFIAGTALLNASFSSRDPAAFMDFLRFVGRVNLRGGRSVVVDSTNIDSVQRRFWLNIALEHSIHSELIVFKTDNSLLHHAQRGRPSPVPPMKVDRYWQEMKKAIEVVKEEKWDRITTIERTAIKNEIAS